MKKLFSTVLILTAVLTTLFADDGGSLRVEDWTYGNIYVKEPNDKIALENEILYFKNNSARVIFDFKNTSDSVVKVPCSFPVVIKVPFKTFQGKARPTYSQWTDILDSGIWEIALNKYISDDGGESWRNKLNIEELKAKDKTLRVEKYEDYLKQLDSYRIYGSTTDENGKYISDRRNGDHLKKYYSGCDIKQDGKKIQILNVGIEVNVEINPASEIESKFVNSADDEFSYLTLVLHFYHELEFMPLKHSKLEVSYAVASLSSSYHSLIYEGFYDISTGGTWKGSMKKFLVASPMSLEIKNGKTKPEKFHDILNFYLFETYKPESEEYFIFRQKLEEDGEPDRFLESRDFPKQNFVSNIQSHTSLKGTYRHYDYDKRQNDDENEPAIKISGYGPETCFDSDPYNGWVEGQPGDGINDWIGFTLEKKVFGPFAINGLTKFHTNSYYNEFDYISQFAGKGRKPTDTWLENNRIKSMNLVGPNGKTTKLKFRDLYAGFRLSTTDLYRNKFNAIENPVILDAGTYKMEIAEVYKGTKYDDTVLGEIWFYEISGRLLELYDSEEKNKNSIFPEEITDLLRDCLVDFSYAEYFMNYRFNCKDD